VAEGGLLFFEIDFAHEGDMVVCFTFTFLLDCSLFFLQDQFLRDFVSEGFEGFKEVVDDGIKFVHLVEEKIVEATNFVKLLFGKQRKLAEEFFAEKQRFAVIFAQRFVESLFALLVEEVNHL
jgi:hypothetical protein